MSERLSEKLLELSHRHARMVGSDPIGIAGAFQEGMSDAYYDAAEMYDAEHPPVVADETIYGPYRWDGMAWSCEDEPDLFSDWSDCIFLARGGSVGCKPGKRYRIRVVLEEVKEPNDD